MPAAASRPAGTQRAGLASLQSARRGGSLHKVASCYAAERRRTGGPRRRVRGRPAGGPAGHAPAGRRRARSGGAQSAGARPHQARSVTSLGARHWLANLRAAAAGRCIDGLALPARRLTTAQTVRNPSSNRPERLTARTHAAQDKTLMLDNPAVVGAATGAAARAAEKRRGRARRRTASGRALRRLGLAALPEAERGCARSPVCGASLL